MMNAMVGGLLVATAVSTLLLARAWQAALFHPGGFRAEFFRLQLPRWFLLPGVLLIVALMSLHGSPLQPALRDLVMVLLFMYVFQGLATVHRTVAGKRLSRVWLVVMYGMLLLIPDVILFIACIGMADSLLGSVLQGGGRRPQ
jgi:hypothetical protein